MPIPAPTSDTATVTTTGKKLIKRAMRLLLALDPDQELSASEERTGLEALNLADMTIIAETARKRKPPSSG
jgi:hypothetical protein